MKDIKDNTGAFVGIGFFPFIFLVLLILKTSGMVDWSWWIICSPLVFHAAAFLMIMLTVPLLVCALCLHWLGEKVQRMANRLESKKKGANKQ